MIPDKEIRVTVSKNRILLFLELIEFFAAMYSRKDAHPEKKSVVHNNNLISRYATGKLDTIIGYISK